MARRKDQGTGAAHVRDLLTRSPAAAQCLERQRRADGLLSRVRDLLSPAARPHCIQAQAKEGLLTVTVDSTAWATRLRYLAPDLVQGLGQSGIDCGIDRVKVRARPDPVRDQGGGRRSLHGLSSGVVEHLLETAACTADSELAEAFRRLASRHRGPPPEAPAV